MANYSFKTGDDLPAIPPDKTFKGFNFTRLEPDTEIFAGVTGLIFINCNLINCMLPGDAELVSCNNKRFSFCTNIKPDLINHGLDACGIECTHMVSKDVVTIDDIVIDTVYTYNKTRVV